MAFRTRLKVRFNHADSAGIMFYGNLFILVHQALERFVEEAGFDWHDWFAHPSWWVPFRKVDAEYFRPMLPGREVEVTSTINRLGETSVALTMHFASLEGDRLSTVKFINVFIDNKTMEKIPIPERIRSQLTPLVEVDADGV